MCVCVCVCVCVCMCVCVCIIIHIMDSRYTECRISCSLYPSMINTFYKNKSSITSETPEGKLKKIPLKRIKNLCHGSINPNFQQHISVKKLRSWCWCCFVFKNVNPVMFNSAFTVKSLNNISPSEKLDFLSALNSRAQHGGLPACSELQGRACTHIHRHTHTHPGLCGSRLGASLIHDLISVEALNRAQGKVRIPDEERKQSWTGC